MIVQKLHVEHVTRIRSKEGRCEGRKPFGHYEGSKPRFERMRTLRSAGMAFDKIAAQLDSYGQDQNGWPD